MAETPSLEDLTVTKVIAYAVWDFCTATSDNVTLRISRRMARLTKILPLLLPILISLREGALHRRPHSVKADAIALLGGLSACRNVSPEHRAVVLEGGVFVKPPFFVCHAR